ncbi:TPA: hypothetical protein ACH3X1_011387 [Trebouxia sp. C0004]
MMATSAICANLQHSQGVSGHGHGQLQTGALQHIGEADQFAPNVYHEDSHEEQVNEQGAQAEEDSLDTDGPDEDAELYPAARLEAYGTLTDSHLFK